MSAWRVGELTNQGEPVGMEPASYSWQSPPVDNVQRVLQIEEELAGGGLAAERLGDRLVAMVGSGSSVLVHVLCFGAWIVINKGLIPGLPPFDPYPFSFLTMAVSLEAIVMTLCVLNAQNRMNRQADRRAHLDLQVNLLAEQESTATLRLLESIAERLHIPASERAPTGLKAETDIETLARDLDQKLPT
jgi:uncharacterized membrane protein